MADDTRPTTNSEGSKPTETRLNRMQEPTGYRGTGTERHPSNHTRGNEAERELRKQVDEGKENVA